LILNEFQLLFLTQTFKAELANNFFQPFFTIIVAVTEGPVREEQLLHDLCLLGAVTVEITQILTRAGLLDVSISEPLLR